MKSATELSNVQLPTEGMVLMDKPVGWSSHDVVNWVRRRTGVKRVGHAGTLDPFATGLLIVLIGREWTKRQDEFMKQDKEYWCEAELGRTTDTLDSTGTELTKANQTEVSRLTVEQVRQAVSGFRGVITQTVPAYSAVKINGAKLYNLARQGALADTELPTRQVEIKELEVLDFQPGSATQAPRVSLRVVCSSGTYIRSLVHDVGAQLGVGAVATQLRRTRIGQHNLNSAISIM